VLTVHQGPTSPAANAAPVKKDPNAPQPTPLEKLLADAGPIRPDGSDKFFGFENVNIPFMCIRAHPIGNCLLTLSSVVWKHMVFVATASHYVR
jgi:hypothetical protein